MKKTKEQIPIYKITKSQEHSTQSRNIVNNTVILYGDRWLLELSP